jgi:hypothetical protein
MLRLILVATLALSATLSLPAEAKNKSCPPGLAKKAVPCVPPGQAKKWHGDDRGDDEEHDHDRRRHDWHEGDRIRGDYVLIPRAEWDRLRLRDYRDGSRYLQIDNQILRVMRDTLVVIEAVRILDRVLN